MKNCTIWKISIKFYCNKRNLELTEKNFCSLFRRNWTKNVAKLFWLFAQRNRRTGDNVKNLFSLCHICCRKSATFYSLECFFSVWSIACRSPPTLSHPDTLHSTLKYWEVKTWTYFSTASVTKKKKFYNIDTWSFPLCHWWTCWGCARWSALGGKISSGDLVPMLYYNTEVNYRGEKQG